MSGAGEWGYTLPPDMMAGDIALALAEADAPQPHKRLPPGKWIKRNLINTKLNTAITVVLVPLVLYLAYRAFMFLFVNGQWEPVRSNLELYMLGLFPRSDQVVDGNQRWRVIAELLLLAPAIGTAIGLTSARAKITAAETGQPYRPVPWRTLASSYWALVLFVVVLLLAFTRTLGPTLLVLGCVAGAAIMFVLTRNVPKWVLPYGWTFALLLAVVSFQMLTGTGGWAWAYTTLTFVPAAGAVARTVPNVACWPVVVAGALVGVATLVLKFGWIGVAAAALGAYAIVIAVRGNRTDATRIGLLMVIGGVIYLVYDAIGLSGVDWSKWGGLQLNLVVTTVAILLAFPLGILLALGRRSKLPAIKVMSVVYIEFFRGAPLITFLLAATYFLSYFLGADSQLSQITRAIAAITLFSAAYMAEIIRGGLNSVPSGQVEAGQALGLSAGRINRMVVMPQALRAVIPAMVGQFISLFKDTSLLTIIAVSEFLGVRDLVANQAEFRGVGVAEGFFFVAFGFWAVSFTMSRESQRLERKLGVGQR
jgi:general L-amino acid transport system permease protein